MTEDNKKINQILDKTLGRELSEAERGEIYANFAQLYLRSVNKINREYEVILDSAINILKDLNSREKALAAKIGQVSR